MLREIRCDKFINAGEPRPPIIFHPGLNVILGNEQGANSIGKSTFLLIIDFVFGGDDYPIKATDVIRNIKDHTIFFVFEFNKNKYYFSRSTDNFQIVSQCDENFVQQNSMKIGEFRAWLSLQYSMTQEDLTFRNAVSRFFRVYQRGNLNEKRPLDFVHQNKEADIIIDLEKLFDKYSSIKHAKEVLEKAQQEKDAYSAAGNIKLISFVSSKKEYKRQQELLAQLIVEQQQYDNISSLDRKNAEELQNISIVREELQQLRCTKTKLRNKRIRILSQLNNNTTFFENDFHELSDFFPSIDTSIIEKVESFHQQLSAILKDELQIEIKQVELQLSEVESQIQVLEKQLIEFDIPNNISTKILKNYATLDRQINEIKQQLSIYDTLIQLKKDISVYRKKFIEISKPVLSEISLSINEKMQQYDNIIYGGTKEPPVFSVDSTKYDFETTNDSGTGTSYKSLIVFDLAILTLTNLPALIHDSLIFKNIGDQPIEKILEIYETFPEKQIFIALDKSSSYNSSSTEGILNKNAVLTLSDNAASLFGRCWSKKQKNSKRK